MNIKWTDKITNEELWRIAHQKSIENQIKGENGIGLDTHYVKNQEQQRRLHWIGILRDIEEEVG